MCKISPPSAGLFMEYRKVAAVQGFKIKLNETIEYSAMPHETEILANESGIQYQGVNDASSVTGEYPIQGLMTGIFKRGRFDRPMTIHKSNIKAMLGHEPKNPYYNAVQDALETGVPSVQVLRIKGGGGSSYIAISPDLQYEGKREETRVHWDIEINGQYYAAGVNDDNYMDNYLEANQNTLGISGEYLDNGDSLHIYNITNERKFVRLIPSIPYINNMKLIGNSTAVIDNLGVISFWLEANNKPPKPEPEPEPEICNCESSWVLIPELTPSVKIGRYDELVMGIKNYVQNTTMSYSADTAVIDLLRSTLNLSDFVNHLELIRCDSKGTLLRNKTNDCLTISMWSIIKDANGNKEYISYLSEKDLCAYDANEVIPDSAPENWDIKYKVNGQWIYETTGPIVELSEERNNLYRNVATELVFNNTVTEVSYGAFSFWISLTKLTLGENITAIRARAFSSLKSVLELTIPDSVEFIGNEAFRYAEKVKNITLGTGVTTIESYAFTDSYVLNAFIMTGLTPPRIMQYPMLVMASGSNGYTTGVIFVPDEAFDSYKALQMERLRKLSQLSTYDFTVHYHWSY